VDSYRKGILANLTAPINYCWAFCKQMLLIGSVAALAG
jgi:hypothetical protein